MASFVSKGKVRNIFVPKLV